MNNMTHTTRSRQRPQITSADLNYYHGVGEAKPMRTFIPLLMCTSFILILGGAGGVESSTDSIDLAYGIGTCIIGLLTMGVSVVLSNIYYGDDQNDI